MKKLVIGTGNKNKVLELVPFVDKTKLDLSGEWSLADDTGVFIDALDGRPGIYAARYAGVGCDFSENVAKVLRELDGVPMEKRTAMFASVIALCIPGRAPETFRGECKGYITSGKQGNEGFGYDPIFWVESEGKTFAEMTSSTKNVISHRALAMKLCVLRLGALALD